MTSRLSTLAQLTIHQLIISHKKAPPLSDKKGLFAPMNLIDVPPQ